MILSSQAYLHQLHTSLSHPRPLHWGVLQEQLQSSAGTSAQSDVSISMSQ